MDSDNDTMLLKVQRHYRRQLDFKNCVIQDHLRRQRIYLSRLRDFISRIPFPLREGRYEYLMKSLEDLEVHFLESQEDFCNLQCVIHNLDAVVKTEEPTDSPSSSTSCDPSSIGGYQSSSQTMCFPTDFFQNQSRGASSDSNSFSVLPSTSSSSSDSSPHQPQQAKRKRRRVARPDEGQRSARSHVPRPGSSSSDTVNSPPSPTSSWLSKGKKRSAESTFDNDQLESSFLGSKRTVTSGEVCPLKDDSILPDFSLFG